MTTATASDALHQTIDRQRLHALIDALPAPCTVIDAIDLITAEAERQWLRDEEQDSAMTPEELAFIGKAIAAAEADLAAGRVVPHAEVMREIASWAQRQS